MGIASDFVLVVIAGFFGGLLARVLKLPLLVGYVLAGVLVGPHTAGPTVVQVHDIELLAEIGVALLLFALGMEISLGDLKPVRSVALFGGPLQIIVTGALAAIAAILLLGIPASQSIWLGAMAALSSTMVVLKTLSDTGTANTLASRVMLGLLVIQDLAVVPMIIILPQLQSPDHLVSHLIKALAIAAAFLAVLIVGGTRLLPKLLKHVLRWGSHELFLIGVVAAGVGLGAAAHQVGLSFALGAFVAGLVLSESEFSHQALSDLIPLRDVFGLLFFVTVGMLFDPKYAYEHMGQIAIGVLLIFVGKAVVAGGIAWLFGYRNMAPWIVGFGISQIGEFSFVLARTGQSTGALSMDTYNFALACTVLTMAFSPLVSRLALPLGRSWQRLFGTAPLIKTFGLPQEQTSGHVVVAGCGRSGRAVARVLMAVDIPLVIADSDHGAFTELTNQGVPSIWGDVTKPEILHACKIETAHMLVITIPDPNIVELCVKQARKMNYGLVVIARAVHEGDVSKLRHIGVSTAIQPEFEGGVEMVRQALVHYSFSGADAERQVEQLRRELYEVD